MMKQKIKSFLHSKLKNLLCEDFASKNDCSQYGLYIHQLFNYIGSLHMFSDDTIEKIKEAIIATQTNASYLANKNNQNKKVVYTCLTGNYDTLPLHSYLAYDWDYVCFTDSEELLKAKQFGAWRIRPIAFSKLDNARNNRWHKTHPHVILPDYDESIYIDANIAIKDGWIFNLTERKGKFLYQFTMKETPFLWISSTV